MSYPVPHSASPEHQAVRPTNAKAVIALCTAFCFPVLAVVFGVKARREIARTGEAGQAYATWGLGLGVAWCALIVLYIVGAIFFVALAGSLGAAASA